jgi:hypothetical protein
MFITCGTHGSRVCKPPPRLQAITQRLCSYLSIFALSPSFFIPLKKMASNAITTISGSSDDVMTTQEMNKIARTFADNPDSTEISLSQVALAFAMCNQERKTLKVEVTEKNQAIGSLNMQLTRATNLTASQHQHTVILSERLYVANDKVQGATSELLNQQKEVTSIMVANASFSGALILEQSEKARLCEEIAILQKEAAKQKVLYEALERELYQTRASLEALTSESSSKKKTPNNPSSKCHPKCKYQKDGCNRDHSSS